jgi:hypothetical protein
LFRFEEAESMEFRTITKEELDNILRKHKAWVESNEKEGTRANLSGANLSGASLGRADLSRANLNGANLRDANLSRANLNGAYLNGADLRDANLSRANLSGADLIGTDLSRANLNGADLINADLSHSNLNAADLSGASLFYANLQKADFRGATLSKVRLQGADLTEADLTAIHIDTETAAKIPDVLREKYEGSWIFLKDEIERSIEFPEEYFEAGTSILSYFGSILRKKYPDKKASVQIKQDGLKVTMVIETAEGDREIIEKTLNDYGLVITGQMPLEEFTDDKFLVTKLQNKIEVITMELRQEKRIHELAEKQYGERIQSLEGDVQWLRNHVGGVLTHSGKSHEDFIELLKKHTDIKSELEFLHKKLSGTAKLSDMPEIEENLDSIGNKKPEIKQKLKDFVIFSREACKSGIYWDGLKQLYDIIKEFLK